MIAKDQVRLYQMILAGLHAFFGAVGVLIGLTGLILPFGIVALMAYKLFESFQYALMDGYLSYWLEDLAGQLMVTVVITLVFAVPALVALITGAIGLGTAYGLYARKPWVKYLAIAAALDCFVILGLPLGLFGFFGIAMGIGTILLTWQADGAAELNDGPPGMATATALPAPSATTAATEAAAAPSSAPMPSAPPPPPPVGDSPPPPPPLGDSPPPPPPHDPTDPPKLG